MKTEETYKIAGFELGWKRTIEHIDVTITHYSGYVGKICDKYKEYLEKIGMKTDVNDNPTEINLIEMLPLKEMFPMKKTESEDENSFLKFGDTLFNVPGAFEVSKKEDGADCYES
ncbi:MAG: hypothetical protein WA139_06310 [Candidatus Aenigmatarchaeota archaeon]